jgi:hypothetical protein
VEVAAVAQATRLDLVEVPAEAAEENATAFFGGAGTSGQGNAGGNGQEGAQYVSGGGGGAGTAGLNVTGGYAGDGGAGIVSSISGNCYSLRRRRRWGRFRY